MTTELKIGDRVLIRFPIGYDLYRGLPQQDLNGCSGVVSGYSTNPVESQIANIEIGYQKYLFYTDHIFLLYSKEIKFNKGKLFYPEEYC